MSSDCGITRKCEGCEDIGTEKCSYGIKIERDAGAELVRLQKETHLLEHGFYDNEVYLYWNTHPDEVNFEGNGDEAAARRLWFKKKFPEFFTEEK